MTQSIGVGTTLLSVIVVAILLHYNMRMSGQRKRLRRRRACWDSEAMATMLSLEFGMFRSQHTWMPSSRGKLILCKCADTRDIPEQHQLDRVGLLNEGLRR